VGEEERLALRKGPRIEDAVIGTFVVLALLYPLLVTLLIYLQEKEETSEEVDILRTTYLFVTGLEDCSPETASRIAQFMEEELLQKLGGIAGLVDLCRRSKALTAGSVTVEENIQREGNRTLLRVHVKVRERGVVRRKLLLDLKAVRDAGGFRIEEVGYAEGR